MKTNTVVYLHTVLSAPNAHLELWRRFNSTPTNALFPQDWGMFARTSKNNLTLNYKDFWHILHVIQVRKCGFTHTVVFWSSPYVEFLSFSPRSPLSFTGHQQDSLTSLQMCRRPFSTWLIKGLESEPLCISMRQSKWIRTGWRRHLYFLEPAHR